jgi:hypothetical protein
LPKKRLETVDEYFRRRLALGVYRALIKFLSFTTGGSEKGPSL